MQEKLYNMLVHEDEITWQTIIYDLIKNDEMDPWDIDVSALTGRYIQRVKDLKEHDFRISGKVLLAAAILLRIQSYKLVGEDLAELDRLISGPEDEDSEDDIFEDLSTFGDTDPFKSEKPELFPRTPQPRKRKVSVYELVKALEKALEVKKRRVIRNIPPQNITIPDKKRDITLVIIDIYQRIKDFFGKNKGAKLTFDQLIPSDSKEDKVLTFIPLLHLSNQRKVDLEQERHFGEISVYLARKEVEKELGLAVQSQ